MKIDRRQFVATSLAAACPVIAYAQTPRPDIAAITRAMTRGRFATYNPTLLVAPNGTMVSDQESVRADMLVLRPYFDGLVMYNSIGGNDRVPDLAAREFGIRSVIAGVWDINSQSEIQGAINAWKRNPDLVIGLVLGNEVVSGKRGSWADLARALDSVRAQAPGLPLSTTESFSQFLDNADARPVMTRMDFMTVNIHPTLESWFKGAPASKSADFVVSTVDRLAAIYPGPILVQETGEPSGPVEAGFDEDKQAEFYRMLEQRFPPSDKRAFSYFSAIDALSRTEGSTPGLRADEPHWGVITSDWHPKKIIAGMSPSPG